ncbi:MAG: prolipoprotein diacylglyceryl transferase [Bacteroidales bacterium]
MLAYIHWDIDPRILVIGDFELRYYGLLFASGFFAGYYIMHSIFKREGIPLKELDLLTTLIVIGTIAGARLGHVFFYQPGYFLANPLEILMVWHGGLASHGGAIGILLALIYYRPRSKKRSYLWILDRLVIATALAGGFIRLGNLMNSEIIGKPTMLPWAFIFSQHDLIPRHPAQLYEALVYFIIALILYWIYRKHKRQPPRGRILGWFFISVFGARFLIEFLKIDQADHTASMLFNMGQWLSIPFILAGVVLLYFSFSRKALQKEKTSI